MRTVDAVEDAVAKFDRPELEIGPTPVEMRAWIGEGACFAPPLAPEDAIRRMIPTKHEGLLVEIGKKYRNRGKMDFDDILGEGRLGLIRAAQLYDPGLGMKFCTYGVIWIRQAIGSAYRNDANPLRLPAYLVERALRVEAKPELLKTFPPKQRARVADAVRIRSATVVRDRDCGGAPLADLVVAREEVFAPLMLRDVVRRLLREIPSERDRRLLIAHHGLDKSAPLGHAALGRRFGISTERARRVVVALHGRLATRASDLGIDYQSCFGNGVAP